MLREIDAIRNKKLEPLDDPGKVTGFVSPAEDYKQRRLHITQKLVGDPINTHYFEAESDEMIAFGITKGTILVVDRSKPINNGSIIVCTVDDEWLTRKLLKNNNQVFLSNGNDSKAINVTGRNLIIFGVVTWSCQPQDKKGKYVSPGRLQ